MRIAYVSQPWDEVVPPVQGGSLQIITYALARRLARSHAVAVYCRQGRGQPREEEYEGVRYRRIPPHLLDLTVRPLSLMEHALQFPTRHHPLFSSHLYFPVYPWRVSRALREFDPDIIHVFNFSQYLPILRSMHPRAKLVLHMQCAWLSQLDRGMIARRLRCADAILGCSDYITDGIRQAFPEAADRAQTIYNGVDVGSFFSEPGIASEPSGDAGQRVLLVARVSPEKGVHVLIDAFRTVLTQCPDAHLDIVGPLGAAPYDFIVVPDHDRGVRSLRRYYTPTLHLDRYMGCLRTDLEPALARRVTFHGPVDHLALVDHYREASLFVFPSVVNEAFGIPVVEAMSCGRAVVSTVRGGIPELVEDGRNGLLVAHNDPAALAAAITRLLNNAQEREQLGREGRSRACTHFSWDSIADEMVDCYSRMLARTSPLAA